MGADDVLVRAALLMLADGRFPAGGYAHSGGLEPAVENGSVRTVADLEGFLVGRLRSAGLVAATFAAAACLVSSARDSARPTYSLDELDRELDARTPSPAQRDTSRALGRQLVRAVAAIAPQVPLEELGRTPHHPVALGVVYAGLGVTPRQAALASLHETAAGPVSASVRLLSVDPFETHGVLARLGPLIDDLASKAAAHADSIETLPAHTGPLLDTNAERHRTHVTRLFAS